MRALLHAIGFLTRIPVPIGVFDDPRARSASLAWYPLVGLLLGALLAALAWLLRDVPPLLSAALVVLAWVALTGALHLDGLADSADAWIGGLGDRERTLAIMKDPRCGPAGVVALVLVLLLKFAALASLSASSSFLIVLAPLLARTALTLAFISTPYVRAGGLGGALVNAPRVACICAVLAGTGASVATVVVGSWAGAVSCAVALLVFVLWRRACLRRIDGITGDTAGALAELIEAAVLVTLAIVQAIGQATQSV
ncbi:adenosylcobinamide-GDP ribazoletransferase [Lysobacter fragariae]